MKIIRVKIGYQPSLTNERVVEIISNHFGYEVGNFSKNWPTVMKNALVAVTVRVYQYENSTEINIAGNFSTKLLTFLMFLICLTTGIGCILIIVFGILQLVFEKEVVDFIKSSPDFYLDNKPQ